MFTHTRIKLQWNFLGCILFDTFYNRPVCAMSLAESTSPDTKNPKSTWLWSVSRIVICMLLQTSRTKMLSKEFKRTSSELCIFWSSVDFQQWEMLLTNSSKRKCLNFQNMFALFLGGNIIKWPNKQIVIIASKKNFT